MESRRRGNEHHSVFINTNLNTRLSFLVSKSETILDLKNKLMLEHLQNFGEINIQAVKVKRGQHLYHIPDDVLIHIVFQGVKKSNWYLSVDASCSQIIASNTLTPTKDLGIENKKKSKGRNRKRKSKWKRGKMNLSSGFNMLKRKKNKDVISSAIHLPSSVQDAEGQQNFKEKNMASNLEITEIRHPLNGMGCDAAKGTTGEISIDDQGRTEQLDSLKSTLIHYVSSSDSDSGSELVPDSPRKGSIGERRECGGNTEKPRSWFEMIRSTSAYKTALVRAEREAAQQAAEDLESQPGDCPPNPYAKALAKWV